MSRHTHRLIKSIRTFGLRNGIAVFWPYLTHRLIKPWRWTQRSIAVRGIPAPVSLRPGVSDWIVLERIFMDEEYDPISATHDAAIRAAYDMLLADGKIPLIIDCGANIGLSAIWFARRFPHAAVLAVEPEPGNVAVLRANAARVPNITAIAAAISDRCCRVTLASSDNVPWAWRTSEAATDGAPDGAINTVTIPDLIARNPDYRPLIVKIDIEGAETSLLRSNTAWLADTRLVIFEMHDWMSAWGGSGHAFFSTLSRQPRDYLIRGENIFAYHHATGATAQNIFADDVAHAG
jgi:FkbM family methyltransferase